MKKTLIGLLALLMVSGFVALAQADKSVGVTVKVTITSILDIYVVSGSTITFALPMDPGEGPAVAATATVIKNKGGGIAQTYKMYATSPSGWSAKDTPGTDEYVLKAAFNATVPAVVDFDTLDNTLGEGSSYELTASTGTLTIGGTYTGASVAYDAERSIWYSFQPPLLSTLDGTLDITVTITAIKG